MNDSAGRMAAVVFAAAVCGLVCLSAGAAVAQPAPAAPAPATAAQPAPDRGDAWGFEEEEVAPGPIALVRAHARELAAASALFAFALAGFFRKSERLKTITLVASLAYFGIYRSELLSIVNIFGLVSWNLPILQFNLAWYLFAGFSILSTVLWGRLYCGRICAFGALTQLMDRAVPAKWRVELPTRLERRASYVKYGLLAAAVGYFLVWHDASIYKYIEPFWLFSGRASLGLWIALAVLLIATVFVRNLYCRFLCPVGAFLGLLSGLTVFRIKRWSECKTCKICEKTCEWGAIDGPRIIKSECVRCDDCERLYLDQQKCPHWIIIRRRSDFTARPSATPTS